MVQKYIGKGAYGCVFMPALKCKNNDTVQAIDSKRDQKLDVGKIFKHPQDFLDEMRAYKIIKSVDPKNEWSLPIRRACKSSSSSQNNDVLMSCPFIREDREYNGSIDEYMQLVMPYGGISLRHAFHSKLATNLKIPISDIVRYLKHVLKGLIQLDGYGYVHMDVKPANILVRVATDTSIPSPPKKTKIYLIDYSLLQKKEGVYDYQTNRFIFKTKYVWYPPEFTIFYALKKGRQSIRTFAQSLRLGNKSNTGIESDAPNKYSSTISSEDVIKSCLHVFDIPQIGLRGRDLYRKQIKELQTFLKDLGNMKGSVRSIFDQYVHKIDVYSTGVTFLNILLNFYGENTKGYHALQNILENMVSADPRKRFTLQQAYESLNALFPGKNI